MLQVDTCSVDTFTAQSDSMMAVDRMSLPVVLVQPHSRRLLVCK